VRTMAESGLTELGIVDPGMLTPETFSRVARDLLDRLMEKTKVCLAERRDVFERSLELLMREETLSGDVFREFLHGSMRAGA